jgi:hypothetical protein
MSFMLIVTNEPLMLILYAECRYAECPYAECRYAECRYADCRYAECRGAGWRGVKFIAYFVIVSVTKKKVCWP